MGECVDKVNNTIKCVNGALDCRTCGIRIQKKAYEECGVSMGRVTKQKMIKSDIVLYNQNVTSEYGSFWGI